MGYPIYRRNEPRSYPSDCSCRQMTAEEMHRFNVTEFKPARDTGGKVIKAPTFSPFVFGDNKVKKKEPKGNRAEYTDKHPYITEAFIRSEMAKGKRFTQIAEECGVSRNLIIYRAEKWGLHTPKEQIRGAGKYKGK